MCKTIHEDVPQFHSAEAACSVAEVALCSPESQLQVVISSKSQL